MNENRLQDIMGEFREKFRLDGLSPDDEGVYRLNADGMDIAIADADDGVHFVLWAEIGAESLVCQDHFCRLLLQAMFMGQQTKGASFSIHDEVVYLQQIEGLPGMDLERFEALLENFINTLSYWRKTNQTFSSVVPDMEKKLQEDEYDKRMFATQGFIRV